MPEKFNNIFLTTENLAFSMPLILTVTIYVRSYSVQEEAAIAPTTHILRSYDLIGALSHGGTQKRLRSPEEDGSPR
jgi:hypothetical protein